MDIDTTSKNGPKNRHPKNVAAGVHSDNLKKDVVIDL
jgi:hypothetical protein